MQERFFLSPADRIARVVNVLLTQRCASRTVLPDEDLREVGLTSLDMVNLVLGIEAEFDLRIPESEIHPANFRSISAIAAVVRRIGKETPSGLAFGES